MHVRFVFCRVLEVCRVLGSGIAVFVLCHGMFFLFLWRRRRSTCISACRVLQVVQSRVLVSASPFFFNHKMCYLLPWRRRTSGRRSVFLFVPGACDGSRPMRDCNGGLAVFFLHLDILFVCGVSPL